MRAGAIKSPKALTETLGRSIQRWQELGGLSDFTIEVRRGSAVMSFENGAQLARNGLMYREAKWQSRVACRTLHETMRRAAY